MDALKDELVGVFAQVEDSFHAHDPFAEFADQLTKPLADLDAVEGEPGGFDGDGFDVLGIDVMVIVFGPL